METPQCCQVGGPPALRGQPVHRGVRLGRYTVTRKLLDLSDRHLLPLRDGEDLVPHRGVLAWSRARFTARRLRASTRRARSLAATFMTLRSPSAIRLVSPATDYSASSNAGCHPFIR